MAKPSWRIRRRYIFVSFSLGAVMLLASTVSVLTGSLADVSQLVTGGVALITLILTSYIFGAVWEDRGLQSSEGNDSDG